MVSLQWQTAAGSEIPIQDIFSADGLKSGSDLNSGDQIQIWNGSTFDTYFYRMYKTSQPGKFTYPTSWVKSSAATKPTTDTIAPSVGFWFKRADSNDRLLTMSGGVKATTNEKTITSQYTMMGSAFPTEMILNGTPEKPALFDWASCSHAGSDLNSGDQIQVWNGSTFDTYFYRMYKTSQPGKFTYPTSWVKSSAATKPTTDTIAPGKGFWYKRAGSYTTQLVEPSPIAK